MAKKSKIKTIPKPFKQILNNLEDSIDGVETFLEFHNALVEFALKSTKMIKKYMVAGKLKVEKKDKEKVNLTIKVLEKPEREPKLGRGYEEVKNQALISLVSSLEAFLKDIFIGYVNENYPNLDFDIKIGWKELSEGGFKFNEIAGDLVASHKKETNFQDLQSTKRSFSEVGIKIDDILTKREEEDLIYSQALRHILIHRRGKADRKFIDQLMGIKRYSSVRLGTSLDVEIKDIRRTKKIVLKLANGIIKKLLKVRT